MILSDKSEEISKNNNEELINETRIVLSKVESMLKCLEDAVFGGGLMQKCDFYNMLSVVLDTVTEARIKLDDEI